jgi:hypothetical protein
MADLNDLQREWDSQPEYSEEKMNEIAELVRTRSGSMRSRLFVRDIGEAIAGIFIIVVFGSYWFFAPNAMTKTGIAIAIAGAVEIIVLLQIVQRRGRADFTAVPLKEFVLSEVQMLNRQISLLRYVVWWYLLPLYTGACVFVIGISSHLHWDRSRTFCISFCVGYFVFCAFVWWLNQNARKKTLEPLRDAMQRTYDGLSALDSESAASDSDLVEVLTNPALDAKCQRFVRFVRPSWHQLVIVVFACMGGFLGGVLIQQYSSERMRYEEWPLLGLIVVGTFALVISCVRRIGKDE